MRLLHTRSLRLELFMPGQVPDYVILSHLWGDGEVTFEDFTRQGTIDPAMRVTEKTGFSKLEGACTLAARDGYHWIWIDTCCIDKSSSAELQEAINTMWHYYAESNICYAYMADIPNAQEGWGPAFQRSRWFTRGWTLQELLAPSAVEFYAADWAAIGTKSQRHEEISQTTKINVAILTHVESVDAFSAAEKLSWAAHRRVTREEDEAYCLLGLFEINMPMLYGEGRRKAFFRLQEAIYTSTLDQSLFLFRRSSYLALHPLLADSPSCFCPELKDCPVCPKAIYMFPPISYRQLRTAITWKAQPHEQIRATATSHRHRVSATLQLLDYQQVRDELIYFDDRRLDAASHIAVLSHTTEEHPQGALCLLLFQSLAALDDNVYFDRLEAYPAILPKLNGFTSQKRSRRIFVSPGAEIRALNQSEMWSAQFRLTSESAVLRFWNTNGGLKQKEVWVKGRTSLDLAVQEATRPHFRGQSSAQVFCHISDIADHTRQVNIWLARSSAGWVIRGAYQVASHNSHLCQHAPFQPQVGGDRRSLTTSDGSVWFIALRRLPSPKRRPGEGITLRYQIIVSIKRPSQVAIDEVAGHELDQGAASETARGAKRICELPNLISSLVGDHHP
ncbi:heterokaryon incompatibility protein-domain-containing protein [Xylaria palmicola]|nr:heterokaryon incompatibility protein-domain-containing protein [Xylaria palmicola]